MATTPTQIQFKNVHSHSMIVLYHEPGTAPSNRWCDVCGHRISLGWYCRCVPCDFDTHMLCAVIAAQSAPSAAPQMQFEHVHSQHPMTLRPHKPSTAGRWCNVCGQNISWGSYYQCEPCDFDAHLVCAFISNFDPIDPHTSARAATALPIKQFERIHRQHQMTLLYTAEGRRFCDVCGHQISVGQYYQCAPCNFDAHMLCAIIGNFDPYTGTGPLQPMRSSAPAANTGTRPLEPMRSSAPAANTGTRPQQPMRSSAPAANTGTSPQQPRRSSAPAATRPQRPRRSSAPAANTGTRPLQPWRSSAPAANTGARPLQPYTDVMTAVGATASVILNVGRAGDWVRNMVAGNNAPCHDIQNAHDPVSEADTSTTHTYGDTEGDILPPSEVPDPETGGYVYEDEYEDEEPDPETDGYVYEDEYEDEEPDPEMDGYEDEDEDED